MPRFNDDNTIGDIEGCYLVAHRWPDFHPEFDVRDHLDEFVDRIRAKLPDDTSGIRHNWFTMALVYACEARRHYRDGRIEQGRQVLKVAWEHLASGEKASRQKIFFLTDPDNSANPTP